MAIVTGVLTTLEVLDQFQQVYNSTDPLLIRFHNTLTNKRFVVEYIGGLSNMQLKNITSNYIPAGSTTDFVLAAGSWSDASVSIEIRGQKQDGQQYRIQLDYKWITELEADITIKVHNEGISPTDAHLTKGEKRGENTKAIRHTKWDEFDVILFTTGKLVEMTVLEKGIM